MQVRLASGKTSEEAGAPCKQRYRPGFFLRRRLPERTRNKSSKSEKQRHGRAPSQSAKATAQRDECCGPFHKSPKKADSGLKIQLGRASGTGQVRFLQGVLGEVFPNGLRGQFSREYSFFPSGPKTGRPGLESGNCLLFRLFRTFRLPYSLPPCLVVFSRGPQTLTPKGALFHGIDYPSARRD